MPPLSNHTVCLALFVKPNSVMSPEALGSLRPHISSWVVISTGLSDAAVDLIRNKLGKNNGEFIDDSLLDYAIAKTRLFKQAASKANLVLMIEAGEALCEVNSPIAMPPEIAYSYLKVKRGNAFTPEPRLLRSGSRINFEFPTAERALVDGKFNLYEHGFIQSQSSSRRWNKNAIANRFLLDVTLGHYGQSDSLMLHTAELELAQGNTKLALELLSRVNSEKTRVWRASYLAGHLLQQSNDIYKAIEYWHHAFELMPDRAEPLMALARLHYDKADFETSCDLAMHVNQLSAPEGVDYYEPEIYSHQALILYAKSLAKISDGSNAIDVLETALAIEQNLAARMQIKLAITEIAQSTKLRLQAQYN